MRTSRYRAAASSRRDWRQPKSSLGFLWKVKSNGVYLMVHYTISIFYFYLHPFSAAAVVFLRCVLCFHSLNLYQMALAEQFMHIQYS